MPGGGIGIHDYTVEDHAEAGTTATNTSGTWPSGRYCANVAGLYGRRDDCEASDRVDNGRRLLTRLY